MVLFTNDFDLQGRGLPCSSKHKWCRRAQTNHLKRRSNLPFKKTLERTYMNISIFGYRPEFHSSASFQRRKTFFGVIRYNSFIYSVVYEKDFYLKNEVLKIV